MSAGAHHSLTLGQFYPHPPEIVWPTLISEEFILDHWAQKLGGPIIARTGLSVELKTFPIPGISPSGLLDCEFLDIQPNERLMFRITGVDAAPSTLTGSWTLASQGRGTYLAFTLNGFATDQRSHQFARRLITLAVDHLLQRIRQHFDNQPR